MNRILVLFILLPFLSFSQDTIKNYYIKRIQFDQNLVKVKNAVKSEPFEIEKEKSFIEPCILNFLSTLEKSKFLIANPNEPYNATDVVDETLPNRQLIMVYKGKKSCIIEYAHGGIGFHYHIAWFELENNTVVDFWVCNLVNIIDNVDGLRSFINSFDRRIKFSNGKTYLPSLCF